MSDPTTKLKNIMEDINGQRLHTFYSDDLKDRIKALQEECDYVEVKAIAAVGMNFQLGLNGELPWQNEEDLRDSMRRDLANFRELTTGCVVIVGRNTWPSVESLDKTWERLFLIDGAQTYLSALGQTIAWDYWVAKHIAMQRHKEGHGKPIVWIAGGAKTYDKWFERIQEFHLCEIPYDGPADTYLPESCHPRHITLNGIRLERHTY